MPQNNRFFDMVAGWVNPYEATTLGVLPDLQFYKDVVGRLGQAFTGGVQDVFKTPDRWKDPNWTLRGMEADAWKNNPAGELNRVMAGPMGLAPLGIVSPQVAAGLNTAKNLPVDDAFKSAVSNTPNARITDEGLLMRLQRNQHPDQGLQPSVRGGVFYLPEGAKQAHHYSTGKQGYGGSEKITGETLVANPMFVKGATGGKAPEAAYDSLIGKGAYQKMRQDALHWDGGPREIREEAVTKFLEKYAPEMADQAWHILQNSTQGNQLAYALQEAAVASAARKAGHDAVIGYSTARSTKKPFISEVFDVREMNYPDKFGTRTDIWESFQK